MSKRAASTLGSTGNKSVTVLSAKTKLLLKKVLLKIARLELEIELKR